MGTHVHTRLSGSQTRQCGVRVCVCPAGVNRRQRRCRAWSPIGQGPPRCPLRGCASGERALTPRVPSPLLQAAPGPQPGLGPFPAPLPNPMGLLVLSPEGVPQSWEAPLCCEQAGWGPHTCELISSSPRRQPPTGCGCQCMGCERLCWGRAIRLANGPTARPAEAAPSGGCWGALPGAAQPAPPPPRVAAGLSAALEVAEGAPPPLAPPLPGSPSPPGCPRPFLS